MKTRYKIFFRGSAIDCTSDKNEHDVVHDICEGFKRCRKKHDLFQITRLTGGITLINLCDVTYVEIIPPTQSRSANET